MRALRFLFVLGLAIGTIAGWGLSHAELHPATAQEDATPGDAISVVQQVGPSVVTVINQQMFQGFDSVQPVGSGTGFIIDADGHVVTNWHVVAGGQEFLVILSNGDRRPATLVGSDRISDLAVVKIEGRCRHSLPSVIRMSFRWVNRCWPSDLPLAPTPIR